MHWILFAIIAVLLIAMAGRSPRLAFSLLAILIAIGVALYQLVEEEQGSIGSFPVEDVSIRDVRMKSYYADGFKVSGTIDNQSETHDVTELELRFTILDCVKKQDDPDQENCTEIRQLSRSVRVHIPFGESAGFDTTLQPGDLKLAGERRWKFKVVDVTGRAPLR